MPNKSQLTNIIANIIFDHNLLKFIEPQEIAAKVLNNWPDNEELNNNIINQIPEIVLELVPQLRGSNNVNENKNNDNNNEPQNNNNNEEPHEEGLILFTPGNNNNNGDNNNENAAAVIGQESDHDIATRLFKEIGLNYDNIMVNHNEPTPIMTDSLKAALDILNHPNHQNNILTFLGAKAIVKQELGDDALFIIANINNYTEHLTGLITQNLEPSNNIYI